MFGRLVGLEPTKTLSGIRKPDWEMLNAAPACAD